MLRVMASLTGSCALMVALTMATLVEGCAFGRMCIWADALSDDCDVGRLRFRGDALSGGWSFAGITFGRLRFRRLCFYP